MHDIIDIAIVWVPPPPVDIAARFRVSYWFSVSQPTLWLLLRGYRDIKLLIYVRSVLSSPDLLYCVAVLDDV